MKQAGTYPVITAFIITCLFCFSVQAQEITIGVVDTSRIILNSPQGKKMQAELQKEFSEREQELLTAQEELQEMQERMERDAAIMSQTERQELQRGMAELQRDLKRKQEAFREDFQYRRNQELQSIRQKIVQAIQSVAKQNGYDLIIGQGVVHASNQVNITDEVIEYLRDTSG